MTFKAPKTSNHKSHHHKKQSSSNNNNSNNTNSNKTKTDLVEKKRPEKDENEVENINSGFSEYCKSGTGLEMMRMFVVANSLVLFVTIAWPSMKQSYKIVMEFFTGEEAEI